MGKLTAGLILFVSLALAQAPSIDWAKQRAEILTHYRSLVQLDTTNPPGNETRALEYLKKVLEAEGIATKTVALVPSRANLVARLKGNGSKRPLLVMGHTACGAIKGAIDNAQLGNLTGLLAKIKPAVQGTNYAGERSATNYAFVDAVARRNVELTLANIRKDSPVLAELAASGTIAMTGAMYNLETGAVEFLA